jgi:hypothetical protein
MNTESRTRPAVCYLAGARFILYVTDALQYLIGHFELRKGKIALVLNSLSTTPQRRMGYSFTILDLGTSWR